MNSLLDFGFAWISILLAALLSVIYLLRVFLRRNDGGPAFLKTINKFLRKHHKLLGILLVVTGVVHGLFSSQSVFSLNLGTAAWILSILLGLNFYFRKRFARKPGWIVYHRFLTAAFLLILVFHIVDVGGIRVFDMIEGSLGNETAVVTTTVTTTGTTTPAAGNTYKDGTYIGTATGYQSGLKVSVTIKDNQITAVTVVSSNETPNYLTRAKSLIATILSKQTTTVDSVSGATFSSIGIKNAVNNALAQALISGTLPSNQSLPSIRGH